VICIRRVRSSAIIGHESDDDTPQTHIKTMRVERERERKNKENGIVKERE